MSNDAERLREKCDMIARLRHELSAMEVRSQKLGYLSLSAKCHDLEAWALEIEDEVAAIADRLDPPPTRYTGQQWLAGLTRRVGQ
jgi:hypothetical protein